MLYQVAGNQFLIVKKTWPSTLILLFGALTNIILNKIFIPCLGIEGAAIASLCGYVIVVITSQIVLGIMKLHITSVRFCVACVILVLYIIVWRLIFVKT